MDKSSSFVPNKREKMQKFTAISNLVRVSLQKNKIMVRKNDIKLLPINKKAVYLCHQTGKHLPHLILLVVKIS